MTDKNTYDVGYRKPPKHTRFKPGQSGNPKGRRKGAKNFNTDLKETLDMPVPVSENGRRKTISTQRAALMRLREKALNGDEKALNKLLGFAQTHNSEDLVAEVEESLSPSDEALIERAIERRTQKKQPPIQGNLFND